MNSFEKLKELERKNVETVYAFNKETNVEAVVNTTVKGMVALFYGNIDGSDDKIISEEEFNKNWVVEG